MAPLKAPNDSVRFEVEHLEEFSFSRSIKWNLYSKMAHGVRVRTRRIYENVVSELLEMRNFKERLRGNQPVAVLPRCFSLQPVHCKRMPQRIPKCNVSSLFRASCLLLVH